MYMGIEEHLYCNCIHLENPQNTKQEHPDFYLSEVQILCYTCSRLHIRELKLMHIKITTTIKSHNL